MDPFPRRVDGFGEEVVGFRQIVEFGASDS